jgi:RND family efflux transporter MFP subunit
MIRPNVVAVSSAASLLSIALAIAGCDRSEASRTPRAAESKPATVTTVAATERALPRIVEVTGALMADAQTDVAAEVAGRVTAVQVERGDVVRAGAVLARLDDQDVTNQLREAEAVERQTLERLGIANGEPFDPARTPDVRRARMLMERAEADYRRWERLVADGIVARQEFEQKQTDYTTARAQVDTLVNQMRELNQTLSAQRARVAMARKALADTVIKAPYDGVVAEKHVAVGQFLARGVRVATVVRVDPLRVELIVPESAAAAVKRGQRVHFTVQTYPDRRFEGTIAYVGPSLKADTRALVAEALVPNGARALQPGLFATARVELPASSASVMVPVAAVRTEAGVSRLFVTRGDRLELRLVQVGTEVDGWVEVVRGVRAAERVVSPQPDGLADGGPVVESVKEAK